MPVLVTLLALATAVVYFVIRARNAAHAASELADMANDVRNAARRFRFRRKANIHPVESIEDPTLAVSAIASAFLELEDLPTREHREALAASLGHQFSLDAAEVEEACVLGHWFVQECGGPVPAIARLSRKLFRIGGAEALPPLLSVIDATVSANGSGMNLAQSEALSDIKRAFRL